MATSRNQLPNPGAKRDVSLAQDRFRTAMINHPGFDKETALMLDIVDQTEKQRNIDKGQSELIQNLKGQNSKLVNAVSTIGQELDALEKQSAETDQELARIKDLSAKLKPAGDIQQQAIKASTEELKNLEQQVMSLKSQPGMDLQKYKEITSYIEQFKNNKSLDDNDIKKIQGILSTLTDKQGASDQVFNQAMTQLEKTQQSLDAKEERFKGYIEKKGKEAEERTKTTASELQKYAKIVDGYKDKIENFDKDFSQIRAELLDKVHDIEDKYKYLDIKQQKQAAPPLKGQERGDELTPDLPGIDAPQQEPRQASLPGVEEPANPYSDFATAVSAPDDQEYQRAAQMATTYNQDIAKSKPKASNVVPLKRRAAESISEDYVRPARHYEDEGFNKWLKTNLKHFVQIFKNIYYEKLKRINPTYSDQQIAYALEEYADWLYFEEKKLIEKGIPLTKETIKPLMDQYMAASRVELFKQPVEDPAQYRTYFSEGLDKIYENILDDIITETFKKYR